MAESIVSVVVERISDLLAGPHDLLYGVKEEVERIQVELRQMQLFLKDADIKEYQDERVRTWLAEIREIAYDAEDVIDTFILKVARRERRSGNLKKFTSRFTKRIQLHEISTQIKSIRTRIADISNIMQTYGIRRLEGSSSRSEMKRELRRSYPHTEDEDVIILENSKRDLMGQLMKDDQRLRVISIPGMAGLGKTTLAKKVYNLVEVKHRFDCHAWVYISEQYVRKDVLLEILKVTSSSKDDRGRMTEQDLIEKLYNELKENRYLVVLDDVWRTEVWDSLKPAFPNGREGSKVLLTTRVKDVALYADPWSSPIELPFLTIEQGWELLSRKAFPRDTSCEDGFLREFEELGKEMVKTCGGLPLAIVLLGGLLATKKSLNEWKVVQGTINASLSKFRHLHYGGLYERLALSYYDLPYYLKPCFLHFANFPEDWEIHKGTLIRMWIAEGFIHLPLIEEGEETMEDVAEQYLEELVSRCMVQVGKENRSGRGVKTYRVHSLMRDLCLSKASEENFLKIIQQQGSLTATSTHSNMHLTTAKSHRIAIHGQIPTLHHSELLVQGNPHIRSLLFFIKGSADTLKRQEENFMYKNLKLLRVLGLDKVYMSSISNKIGNLIHLRYLVLKGDQEICLPESIGNLQSLHTLDLRGSSKTWLPKSLGNLNCLRHLLLNLNVLGPFQIDGLSNLETLKDIHAKHLIRDDAMRKLTNLRNLKVYFESEEEIAVVLKSPIFELGRLRSLLMSISPDRRFQDLGPLSQCNRLTKLELNGVISEDPSFNRHTSECLPANIAKLALCSSHIEWDPMAMLGKLRNLKILSLRSSSYVGSQMVCLANGFPHLESLELHELEKLKEWRVEEGAMPCLRSLHIGKLPQFEMIPEGLRFVTTLHELTIIGMTKEFENRLEVVGEDFDKVRHIPSIAFLAEI